jgi:hypothetical protein
MGWSPTQELLTSLIVVVRSSISVMFPEIGGNHFRIADRASGLSRLPTQSEIFSLPDG